MARRQKYTDSDIVAAIRAMVEQGEDINPARVRMRLGGGNVARIKAIIDAQATSQRPGADEELPTPLRKALKQLAGNVSRSVTASVGANLAAAWTEATGALQDDNSKMRRALTAAEGAEAAASKKANSLETELGEVRRSLMAAERARDEALLSQDRLTAALRNAESDLRALRQNIESLERTQRLDRDEIRSLQRRTEGLVAELARREAAEAGAGVPTRRRRKST